ncbi:hypothetical protein SKAU_G00257800 [Synaphobranchus kaupii]|uniref:Uncharacterized protein n=1 Tax=Synaphobranchus kaupii TaxID=118154 RepID=A0A9Q1F4G6_SYNKA|nr:hypothetical protein SKAU_G00257800 [Synaphobranchus kaupii]
MRQAPGSPPLQNWGPMQWSDNDYNADTNMSRDLPKLLTQPRSPDGLRAGTITGGRQGRQNNVAAGNPTAAAPSRGPPFTRHR